jgi:hypothetical protein
MRTVPWWWWRFRTFAILKETWSVIKKRILGARKDNAVGEARIFTNLIFPASCNFLEEFMDTQDRVLYLRERGGVLGIYSNYRAAIAGPVTRAPRLSPQARVHMPWQKGAQFQITCTYIFPIRFMHLTRYFFFCGEGPRCRSYGRTAALRLIVQPCDEDEEKDDQFFLLFFQVMEHRWNEIDRGKPCPSATLSTTNPTWAGPVSNPGLRGGRPATNRLNHGTAYKLTIKHLFV